MSRLSPNCLLTIILGNSELLVEQLDDRPQLRAMASVTATAAQRGAELTNRLLAFARRQPLQPRVIDINKRLAGIEGLLRRTLTETIALELECAPDLGQAEVDPGQLEAAILNLAINARDAMPDGGTLRIATRNATFDEAAAAPLDVDPGDHVMVSVSDTGTGMSPEILVHVFEPFFSTKDVGKGSGLGLSMVYGFARQSGGHVRIDSELGRGTVVTLYLPRAQADADTDAAAPAGPVPESGSGRVLLVEDDDLVRAHVRSQLEVLGYDVVAVANGPEALQTLKRDGPFDLLFTDVVMPGGMSGHQLANEALAQDPTLRVLLTSGYSEEIASSGGLAPHMELLQKPYRRQDLAEKLRTVMGRKVR